MMMLYHRVAPAMRALQAHAILRRAMLLASGSSLAQFFMIVYGIVVARQLTPEGYGALAGTFTAVTLAVPLLNWGLDTWLLSQGALSEDLPSLTGSVLVVNTLSALVCGSLLFLLLPALSPEVYLRPLVLVTLVDTWADSLFSIQIAALTVLKRIRFVSSFLLISRGGKLLGAICLVLLGVTSPLVFAGARLLATAIALITALVALQPRLAGVTRGRALGIWRQSLSFGISDLVAGVYLRAGAVLLAILVGASAVVGQFSAAYGLLTALYVFPTAGYSIMLPELTRLSQDRRRLNQAVAQMFVGFTILGMVLWIGAWVVGELFTVVLLGPTYATAGRLLSVLSPILLMKSIAFGCITLLVAVGWQRYRVAVQVIAMLANLLISLWFILQFGLFGLAAAYVLTEAILTAGYIGLSTRRLRSSAVLLGEA